MGEAVIASLVGAAASTVLGGLLTKKPNDPAAPEVKPPIAMPDPKAQKAKSRRKAAIFAGQQLTSADTVLTGNDTLGA